MGTLGKLGTWLDMHAAPLVSGTRLRGIWIVAISNRVEKATASGATLDEAMDAAMIRWCQQCGTGDCSR